MTLKENKWFSSFAKMIGSYKYLMWIASSDTGSNFVLENNSVSHTITHIVILPMSLTLPYNWNKVSEILGLQHSESCVMSGILWSNKISEKQKEFYTPFTCLPAG